MAARDRSSARPTRTRRRGDGLTDGTELDGNLADASELDFELEAVDLSDEPHDHDVDPVEAIFEAGLPSSRSLIRQGDRLKAYRAVSAEQRRKALRAGLAAYERGDFFEAHELLEPAWMGTADLAERELYQGLIKLAAGYVHCVRGNPIGMTRNLEGAGRHLESSLELDPEAAESAGIDLMDLLMEVGVRIRSVQVAVAHLNSNPGILLELAEAAPAIRPRA